MGGRAPKKVSFHSLRKKNGGRVQKNDEKNNDVQVPEMKELVICVFAVGHTNVTHSQCAQLSKRHHTHNSFFLFVLFSLVLLQQVFCKIPANQIIISTYIN